MVLAFDGSTKVGVKQETEGREYRYGEGKVGGRSGSAGTEGETSPETHLYAVRDELVIPEVLEPKGLVSCNCINRGDILGSGVFAPATAR